MTKEEILDRILQYASGALTGQKWGDYGFLIHLRNKYGGSVAGKSQQI